MRRMRGLKRTFMTATRRIGSPVCTQPRYQSSDLGRFASVYGVALVEKGLFL